MPRLSSRDYQIIDLYALGTLTRAEVANRLCCSTATISYCLRKPEARIILDRKRAAKSDANALPENNIARSADLAALHALQTLVELTKTSNAESVRLSAAQTIMQSHYELTRGLTSLPNLTSAEWDLLRRLASLGFGSGLTMTQALKKLDATEQAEQESARQQSPPGEEAAPV